METVDGHSFLHFLVDIFFFNVKVGKQLYFLGHSEIVKEVTKDILRRNLIQDKVV
jgi:hypothetical protein